MSPPRFSFARRLVRPITAPILRAFSNRFVTRGEATHNFSGIAESLASLRREGQELGGNLDEMRRSLVAIERSLAQFRLEEHDQFVQVRLEEEELKAAISDFGGRVRELEKSAAFSRQAIHDLGEELLLPRERVPMPAILDVGVVVATCDRPAQLRSALESLAAQTRKPEAVVVVNDGDDSVDDVVGEFAGRLQISVLRTPAPRSGSSVARNVALDALDTALVAFLDDDNLMWPYWLERGAAMLENDGSVDVIYGAQLRDRELSTTDKSWFLVPYDFERLKKSNFIDLNQLMHRTSDVRFDTRMRRLVDWDYVLKLIDTVPGRTAPVNAIASIYSTGSTARVTVPSWPPDLTEVTLARRNGQTFALPDGIHACTCGYVGAFLPGPNGRPAAGCPRCGSLERHRFLQLFGPLLRAFWFPSTRPLSDTAMVEIAPSHATRPFRETFGRAATVDADPQADGRVVDVVASLTSLPMPSESFDVALVLHVFEHIHDDAAAMRELTRVLRPSGIGIVQVPLADRLKTDEVILETPQEREQRYGQADHVRMYGRDFEARLNAAGLTAASISPRESMPSEVVAKFGLLPDEALILVVRSDSEWAVGKLAELEAMLRKGAF